MTSDTLHLLKKIRSFVAVFIPVKRTGIVFEKLRGIWPHVK